MVGTHHGSTCYLRSNLVKGNRGLPLLLRNEMEDKPRKRYESMNT